MNYCPSCGDEIPEDRFSCEDCAEEAQERHGFGGEGNAPDDSPDDREREMTEFAYSKLKEIVPEGLRDMLPEDAPEGRPNISPRYVCEEVEGGFLVKRPTSLDDDAEWEQVFRLPEGEGELGRRIVALLNAGLDKIDTHEIELGYLRFAANLCRILTPADLTEQGEQKREIVQSVVMVENAMNTPPEIVERAKQDAFAKGQLTDEDME